MPYMSVMFVDAIHECGVVFIDALHECGVEWGATGCGLLQCGLEGDLHDVGFHRDRRHAAIEQGWLSNLPQFTLIGYILPCCSL